ncbi:MAG: MBL fold metallo-hydrolase [Trueperaceae bacterium]|nr:MBL fold metallo-hydrolase [Trueperaceae bacterium]
MTQRAAATGDPERLADGVWRLSLPSDTLPPYRTTDLYLVVGADQGVLVDPGFRDPEDAAQIETLMGRAGVRDLKAVVLTHTHQDHVAGLPALFERIGPRPVYVGAAEAAHVPNADTVVPLAGERSLMVGGRVVRAVPTPGHAPGHLAFHLDDVNGVLCGDLLTAQGASWVGLPDGDVAAYLSSLDRVRALRPAWLAPAHGTDPGPPEAALERARAHRIARERDVLEALDRPRMLNDLVDVVYPRLPKSSTPLLRASVLAHLVKLMRETRVMHLGEDPEGPYATQA